MATPLRIKRSAVPGKVPSVSDLQLGELALNTYDAELYTLRYRPGIGTTEVVKIGGAQVENVLYVNKDGDDGNTGGTAADAKLTIKGAVGVATDGTVIKVAAGTYVEDNPVKVPKQISIVGDTLREVTISPLNANKDIFHVSPGDMFSELTFSGTVDAGKSVIAFDPDKIQYVDQSPYVRFCTNRVANSIGMKVDGSKSVGPFKSMVTDSYTQYNVNGIGVSVSNEGYAQIVSMFTMNLDAAITCHSGGQCDVTNSNSSFGNYGLIADGKGEHQYTGIIASSVDENADKFEVSLSDPSVNISNFQYDNVTGEAIVTTSAPHGFNVGMGVTIADIIVNCNYGSGIHTFTTATNNAITDSGNNSYNVTDATYDDSTGDLVLTTPAASALSINDTITIAANSIKFTCVADNHSTEHSYPRTTDPAYNTPVSVTNVTGTTITVNVGPVSGGQTKTYPDGNVGYVFTVKEVTDSTTFKTDIGISKYVHNYVSGGSVKINLIRPFDGKVVYFDDLYYTVGKIKLTNVGSGYNTPPVITIDEPSTSGTWGVKATAIPSIIGSKVDEIEIISNGRGYTSTPTITFSAPDVGINTATAEVELAPTFYSVKESTPISAGICTITINENVPYAVGSATTVPFYRQSRILASSHSFQYIGSGVDPVNSLPSRGGVTIQENEVDNRQGGLVIYTSTDQGGNFRIGEGVQIDQISGTITGNFYSKSLFANVTPLILALGGDQ